MQMDYLCGDEWALFDLSVSDLPDVSEDIPEKRNGRKRNASQRITPLPSDFQEVDASKKIQLRSTKQMNLSLLPDLKNKENPMIVNVGDASDEESPDFEPLPVPSVSRDRKVTWSVPIVNITQIRRKWTQQLKANVAALNTFEKENKTDISIAEVPGTCFNSITEDWPGEFNFQVHFSDNPYQMKIAHYWTFSPILRKLFLATGHLIETHFSLDNHAHKQLQIRAQVLYAERRYSLQMVQRCLEHESDDSSLHSQHFIHCDDSTATYQTKDKHHSVMLNLSEECLSKTGGGKLFFETAYQYNCHSTCPSVQGRPLKVIFTLESQGIELGRQSVRIHVSKTPFVQRLAEESKVNQEALFSISKTCNGNNGRKCQLSSLGFSTANRKRKHRDDEHDKSNELGSIDVINASDEGVDGNEHAEDDEGKKDSQERDERRRGEQGKTAKTRPGSRLAPMSTETCVKTAPRRRLAKKGNRNLTPSRKVSRVFIIQHSP